MPYSSTNELPQAVRDKYSEKCQRAFMHAFNSVHENTHDEGRASAAGHAAAQRCEANKSAAKGMQMTFTAEAAPAVKFNFLGTGALKSSSSSDGKMRLHGIASSTMRDRHGDVIKESAIDDMVATAANNMTIFLNHSYTIPEDIGGSVESVEKRFDGTDALLALTILIDETNPRATQTWKSVQAGRQVGISIGANLPDGGYTRNKDGTYTIDHVELLEASLVGVPANPKSWVEYAVKALNEAHPARTETEWVSLGAVCPSCGGGKDSPHDGCGSDYHSKAVADAEVVAAAETETTIDTPASPSEETVKAVVDIHIDTDNSEESGVSAASPDAPTSTPEAEAGLLDEDADETDDLLGDTVTEATTPALTAGHYSLPANDLTSLVDSYAHVVKDLMDARLVIASLTAEKKQALTERDAAIRDRDRIVTETGALLTRLSEIPLVRKTSVAAAYTDFRARFSGVYDEDFLDMLEMKKHGRINGADGPR